MSIFGDFFKKEAPLLGLQGSGGGLGFLAGGAGGGGPYAVEIKLWGAGGGGGSRPQGPICGGGGAFVKASFTAASGTVLYAYVGKSANHNVPSAEIGLAGGGGNGGPGPGDRGAPGGGASFVTVSTPHPRALGGSGPHNPFIIAMAAGGGGASGSGGGGYGGAIGVPGGEGPGPGMYGRAASPTAGGPSGPYGGTHGGFMYGGAGMQSDGGPGNPAQGGGGGGSGWWGGGGGSKHTCCVAESGGGGGGVSYGLPSHPAIESPLTFTSASGSNGHALTPGTDAPAGGESDPQWDSGAQYGRGRQSISGQNGYEGRVIINYGPPTNAYANTLSFGYSASDQSVELP